jgi:thiamine biosynthesis protein ThiI
MAKQNKVIVVRFGELWLRGRNRPEYVKKLRQNVLAKLSEEDISLKCEYDRFLISIGDGSREFDVMAKLGQVFGISNYELAYVAEPNMSDILRVCKYILKSDCRGIKIRVNSHRSYKKLNFNSIEIRANVIAAAKEMGYEPANKGFEEELNINVTKESAFISSIKSKGLGGLPVGTSGKAIILLSGGIDSPVAAWYAMKRGAEPVYVHIHAFADSETAMKSKISEIIYILSHYQRGTPKVYYVPSHIFQAAAVSTKRYELVLLKSFMLRVAEKVAENEGADMIFTGESLGQVASQTSSNLSAEQYGLNTPVLRPLIGFDKEEIIRVANRIGTYEVSVKSYKDVCAINSRSPKTRMSHELLSIMLKDIGMDEVVERSVDASRLVC